jgi:hypothetical protein
MLLKLTKIGERESHFKEISYSGFYTIEGFLRPRGQHKQKDKHKAITHTQEHTRQSTNNHKNIWGTSST